MANCPTCHGKGFVEHEISLLGLPSIIQVLPCSNPVCHSGQIHCCDGMQEQPEPDTHDEWRALNTTPQKSGKDRCQWIFEISTEALRQFP